MTVIPESHRDLLERPLFGHLATVRPDGTPQVNPMWVLWDGTFLWFTNTTTRQKYRNVTGTPQVAVSVNDPEAPYRYLEIRGVVERIDPDPNAELFMRLADRYSMKLDGPPSDAPHRVAYAVRPTAVSFQ
ncbi:MULTISPECIES: PPOX class F420-dependent oxidoreductase [Frankia]|uniref:PPOX class F420-dependent oxidoreductase n=1 Tax=Frankia TaxID=1854 RepID=UPI0021C09FB3|nr:MULTISPECIES: PPOX class F420-dependent oxidoreductase [Frankia]